MGSTHPTEAGGSGAQKRTAVVAVAQDATSSAPQNASAPLATNHGSELRIVCAHCGSELIAPIGAPVVRCGACSGIVSIDGKTSMASVMPNGRTPDHQGYLPPSCIISKATSRVPKSGFMWFAICLTSFIIGGGFYWVAPETLPPSHTAEGVMLYLLSVYLSTNVVLNFWWGKMTDPGTPDESDFDSTEEESGKQLQRCERCTMPKPPRTHHCTTCGRCVLHMDHHCVFLDNCVGIDNLRYFMLFLTWVFLSTLWVFGNCCYFFRHTDWAPLTAMKLKGHLDAHSRLKQQGFQGVMQHIMKQGGMRGGALSPYILSDLSLGLFKSFSEGAGFWPAILLVSSVVTLVLVGGLLVYHVYLAYQGKTQLESMFGMAKSISTPKGWAGVWQAYLPPNKRFSVGPMRYLSWLAILVPLPPSIGRRKKDHKK